MKRTSIHMLRLLCGAIMMLVAMPHSLLFAQNHANDTTLNRTVVVEQQYNPDIMDAQKVNVLPEVKELTSTPNTTVEYDKNVTPATVLPGTAMAAYAGEEKQHHATQGYARLGYGSKGNLDTEGNYLFILSPKDRLNVSLGVQGMNGESYYPDQGGKWDSHFYRTKAGIDYLHQYDRMNLDIAGNFGLSNFNYVPDHMLSRQKFTSGDFHAGLTSTDKTLPIQYRIESNLMLYSRAYNLEIPEYNESVNETQVRTKGDFTGEVTEGRSIGVAFQMNNLFYNDDALKNYTTLQLNPYYLWEEEGIWKLRAGVNVDLAFSHGKKFYASPDVRAEYIFSDSYVLYANATGGRILNDFRRLELVNPYSDIRAQPNDSYEQLNAVLGFKMSPATGLWLNIFGGYQQIKDDLYTVESLFISTGTLASFRQDKTNNFNLGAQASYAYKDYFNVLVKGQYYDWDADNEELALRFKPSCSFDFQVGVRPIPELNINLGYEYVKREKLQWDPSSYREKEINNLSVSGTYDLFKGVAMYARFSNLLNKKYQYYPLSPIPGFNFVGGMMFSF